MHQPIPQAALAIQTRRTEAFVGMNRTQSAPEGSYEQGRNLSTARYPALTTRPGRTRWAEERITELFCADGHTVLVSDGYLYLDGEEITFVGEDPKQFCLLGNCLTIWPDALHLNLTTGELGSIREALSTYAAYDPERGVMVLDEPAARKFEPGDSLTIEGCALFVNNRKGLYLVDVQDSELYFAEGSLLEEAFYYTLPDAVSSGVYAIRFESFITQHSFRAPRTLRAGEQLYCIPEIRQSDMYGDQTVVREAEVWIIDPRTRARERLELTAESPITTFVAQAYSLTEPQRLTFRREAPQLDFVCAHENRLFGVSNAQENIIYNPRTGEYETVMSRVLFASELGKSTRWYSYNGWNTDSYAVALGGSGAVTGICSYSGAVLIWREDQMMRLTGAYPAEFYLRTYDQPGVRAGCARSVQCVDGTLFYLSGAGVMAYEGASPRLVSYPLQLGRASAAAAGRDEGHYYLSVTTPEGSQLYAYDTVHGLWSAEDPIAADCFARDGDATYLVSGGAVYTLSDGEEDFDWSCTLAPFEEESFRKKRYQTLRILADTAGELIVESRENENDWQLVGRTNVPGRRVHSFALLPVRCDRLQLRLRGTGKCTIWAIERDFMMGGSR